MPRGGPGPRVTPRVPASLVAIVLTTIGVRYRDPRGQAGSFAIWGTVNHAMPHALPPAWSMLLRRLRDVAGPLAEADSQAWDRALTWMAPFDLGDVWRTGGVVKLPSIVSVVASDSGVRE